MTDAAQETTRNTAAEEPESGSALVRAKLLQRGRRFALPLPDALMAVVLALAALVDFLTPEQLAAFPAFFLNARQDLVYALVVEGGFLMMQGTLVDIATRLRKRPPVWLIAIIVGAVALLSDEARAVMAMAWNHGSAVFVPLLISLAERGTMLWHMPDRSRIEKIAARALIANRITTGLAAFGVMTAIMIAGVVTNRYEWSNLGAWPTFIAGALYFAIGAYDDWRVRGRKFAAKPRVLFRWDPIGIDYLAPL